MSNLLAKPFIITLSLDGIYNADGTMTDEAKAKFMKKAAESAAEVSAGDLTRATVDYNPTAKVIEISFTNNGGPKNDNLLDVGTVTNVDGGTLMDAQRTTTSMDFVDEIKAPVAYLLGEYAKASNVHGFHLVASGDVDLDGQMFTAVVQDDVLVVDDISATVAAHLGCEFGTYFVMWTAMGELQLVRLKDEAAITDFVQAYQTEGDTTDMVDCVLGLDSSWIERANNGQLILTEVRDAEGDSYIGLAVAGNSDVTLFAPKTLEPKGKMVFPEDGDKPILFRTVKKNDKTAMIAVSGRGEDFQVASKPLPGKNDIQLAAANG